MRHQKNSIQFFFVKMYIILVSFFLPQSAHAQAANEFVFSLGNATPFTGLGAQVWPGDSAARGSLIKDLGITWVRAAICPSMPSDMVPFLSTPGADAALLDSPQTSSSQINQSIAELRHELNTLNLQLHLMIGSPPQQWMQTFTWYGSIVNKLPQTYVTNYAQLITGCLLYLRERGIHPISVELVNEPDAYTSAVDPDVYVSLVTETRHLLNQYRFESVVIEGPGTSLSTKALPYLQALYSTGAWDAIGYISAHDWDTVLGSSPAGMPELVESVSALLPHKPIWATEFADESPRWSQAPYDAPPWERTSGLNAADTTEYGAAVASEAIKLAGESVIGTSYWELADQPWESTSWGLLDLNLNRRPAAFALQAIFGNIPSTAYAVGGVCSQCAPVVATTFIKFEKIITAIGNEGNTSANVIISYKDIPVHLYPTKILSVFPQHLDQIFLIRDESGALHLTIPGNSVIVLAN